MEKINKEELMKKLNLTEEEMEKVAGGLGSSACKECLSNCGKGSATRKDKDDPCAKCAAVCP